MEVWSVGGRRYEVVLASDLERHGIALEVWDANEPSAVTLFEVFHHDRTQTRTITVWTDRELPVELVTRALQLAQERFQGRPATV